MSMLMGIAKTQYKDYGIYDKSISADQQCELRFMFVNIKSFNGKSVSWGDKANNQGHVKIPAGKNTIVFDWVYETTKMTDIDYNSLKGTTTYTYTTTTSNLNNIIFPNVEMLSGHKYFIGGGKGHDGKLRVWLLDQTNTPIGYYGDVVANAPKKSKKPTQFEGKWKNTYGETFEFAGNTWLQTLPPLTGSNTGPNKIEMKGTFVFDDKQITLYATDTAVDGGIWLDIKAMKQSYIYKYSLSGNTLLLELPWMLPELPYIKQQSATSKISFDGFEGFWEMPNKQIMHFHNNVLTYMEADLKKMINTGVFTHTNRQFVYTGNNFLLQFNAGSYNECAYTPVPEGIKVTTNNPANPANGVWKKRKDISQTTYNSNNPFVGYWESKTKDKIQILNVSAYGWGDWYTCSPDYLLVSKEMIDYDNNIPLKFTYESEIGDGISVTYSVDYSFDGGDLLVGTNKVRYTKK